LPLLVAADVPSAVPSFQRILKNRISPTTSAFSRDSRPHPRRDLPSGRREIADLLRNACVVLVELFALGVPY